MYKKLNLCYNLVEKFQVGVYMSKIRIKVMIQTTEKKESYETIALYHEGILKYKEPDHTTVTFHEKEKQLIRENNELKMLYTFEKGKSTEGIIHLKEFQKELGIQVYTQEIKAEKDILEITFQIEEETFIYHIEKLK